MSYFEPDGIPEEVKKSKEVEKRIVRIRFKTKQDAIDFTRNTGITFTHKSTAKISFPVQDIFSLT